jgi:hypothetical protein
MGIETPNLEGVEAWSSTTILPPGKHQVTITEAKEGTSSGGHPEIEMQFSGDQGEIREWLQFTERTFGKVKQFMEAVGVQAKPGEDFPTGELEGKRLGIMVTTEPRQDDPSKTRSRVAAFLPSEGGNGSSGDQDLPF